MKAALELVARGAGDHLPESAEGLSELAELLVLRARLAERHRRARQSEDVIVTTMLADQLAACLKDVERKIHDVATRAAGTLRRSA